MERYNEYKDSGVQWLGEIPSHWEVVRNKFIFRESEERNSERRYQLLSFSKNRGIVPHAEINDKESSAEDLSKYKILHIGQLLENRLQAWNGMFSHSEIEGCVSPDYSVFSLIKDGVNIKYVSYLFRTPLYIEQWANASKGIGSGFNRLYTPQFNAIQCLIPPFEEQNRMVTYLDEATSKIDAAIAQQQKMIDLLNERKQIIINNAVTKGLNPNVKMKDSGVNWIGEIPEHWEVTKLKSIGTTINGVSHDSSYFGEGYPFVSYSDVYKNSILPLKVNGLAKSSTLEQKIFSVEEGDVFFTRTSETAEEIGITSTCVKTIPQAVFAGFLIRFRPRKGILDSKFSSFYFRAQIHRSYFVKEMNLVIRASLSQQLLKGLPVLLPHIQEQREIADYLNAETGKIEQAINTYTKQISLLQERKQIIINDVVTGKVKVTK